MNQPRTHVIVGGVAGGMSAATRLRRLSERDRIVVVERSGHVSFANCGLPYYAGGVIADRDALLLQTPESLAARFRIEVRVHTEVTAIDTDARAVTLRSVAGGGDEQLAYDSLLLAPGATPVRPRIPGLERALSVRDVESIDAVVAAMPPEGEPAVVIGGGFIGVEMAENLVERGLRVTLVEAQDQVMAPLDVEMAALVHDRLGAHGVDLRLGAEVTELTAGAVRLGVDEVPAAIVVAAFGVRPDSTLAVDAGLEVAESGAIVVDERMRTSAPGVYAVGDAVQKKDALDGSATLVPLANTANMQGRLVADVIAGRDVSQRPVHGTAIVGVFGLGVASTGWNEKRLQGAGRDYRAIHTYPSSHAGYYPGAAGLALKLLVDPETDAILGAQAIGEQGADKRIDVIATAMQGGLTASDLAELELAYSPQYGSAKDPVNMLGWINRNIAEGLVETVQWHELEARVAAGARVIDVRTPTEFDAGAIPGAQLIPVDELRDRLDELPDGELVVHCAVGLRGYLAARLLTQHGRRVANLDGGYRAWSASPAGRTDTGEL
ncbi:FAD-dependent oxidoreductase [Mariniluteicoccus flavus]